MQRRVVPGKPARARDTTKPGDLRYPGEEHALEGQREEAIGEEERRESRAGHVRKNQRLQSQTSTTVEAAPCERHRAAEYQAQVGRGYGRKLKACQAEEVSQLDD